jgi:hypothetical protein
MFNNLGWHTQADVQATGGYAWSTVGQTLEYLVMQRKLIRDGAPNTKSGIKYAAIVDYFGGFRLKGK